MALFPLSYFSSSEVGTKLLKYNFIKETKKGLFIDRLIHGLWMGHSWISAVWANLSILKPIFLDMFFFPFHLKLDIWNSES